MGPTDKTFPDNITQQPIHRVAAIVLGYRQNSPAALDGVDDFLSPGHGVAQGLLQLHVLAGLQQGNDYGIVGQIAGDDIGGFDLVVGCQGLFRRGVDRRDVPQQFSGSGSSAFGLLASEVADAAQIQGTGADAREFGIAAQVALTHHAAADEDEV